jgi:hypothetical protein
MRGKKPSRSFEPFPSAALAAPLPPCPMLAADIVPFRGQPSSRRPPPPSAAAEIARITERINQLLERKANTQDEHVLIALELMQLAEEAARKGYPLPICYQLPSAAGAD